MAAAVCEPDRYSSEADQHAADVVARLDALAGGVAAVLRPDLPQARALLVETVLAARRLHLDERVREVLGDDLRWELELYRQAADSPTEPGTATFHSDRALYRFLPTGELPPAHSPGKRTRVWREALFDLRYPVDPTSGDRREAPPAGPWERELAAGRAWQHALTPDAIGPVRHTDLPDVASVVPAVEAVYANATWTLPDIADVAAHLHPFASEPFRLTLSFFAEPIVWDGSANRVDNGQHRIAAARLQGVERLLVRVG